MDGTLDKKCILSNIQQMIIKDIDLKYQTYKKNLIVPGFYHLFYVDCKGKPAPSLMIRIDKSVSSPLE